MFDFETYQSLANLTPEYFGMVKDRGGFSFYCKCKDKWLHMDMSTEFSPYDYYTLESTTIEILQHYAESFSICYQDNCWTVRTHSCVWASETDKIQSLVKAVLNLRKKNG